MQGSKGDKALVEVATEHFGDRCFVDPVDKSGKTGSLIVRDMNLAFSKRGNHGEWNIYELWSSNNARYWVEGLKRQFAERGFAYNPKTLTMETFGSWSGCHHKYSNFMATYLGMTQPARLHGETDLCTLKDFPMDVGEFVECAELERHVLMTLFRRTMLAHGAVLGRASSGIRAAAYGHHPHRPRGRRALSFLSEQPGSAGRRQPHIAGWRGGRRGRWMPACFHDHCRT